MSALRLLRKMTYLLKYLWKHNYLVTRSFWGHESDADFHPAGCRACNQPRYARIQSYDDYVATN